MKIIKILGTLILLLSFSGCYDANEPNDYAYVIAIGIDKAKEENEYEISIQFAKPAQISGSGSEEGGSGGETLGLVTVEAPTIYSGINIANNIVSKRFQLSHTKIIVISEEIAKKGINNIIDTIVRSSDLRPNMYITVAKEGAKEYLASVEPEMEINPVKYYQLIFENKSSEFVPKSVSQNIYFYINSSERDVVLPMVSESKEGEKKLEATEEKSSEGGGGESGGEGQSGGKGQKSEGNQSQMENIELPKTNAKINYGGFEYLMKEYVAGNVTANKKNKSEAMGMAVFSGDKMIGEMNDIEAELYNIMNGKFIHDYATFYNEKFPDKPIVMTIRQYKPPAIDVKTSGENPKISVKVSMEGSLISVGGEYLVEEDIYNYEKEVEGYIKEDLAKFLNKTSREFGTDILGFGSYAKKNFLNYNQFEEYDWNSAYKRAEFETEVDFTIRRTGLIVKNNKK